MPPSESILLRTPIMLPIDSKKIIITMMVLLKMWLRKATTCSIISPITLGKPATELNTRGQAITGKHRQRLWNRPRVTGGFQWRARHCPAYSSWIMILRRFWLCNISDGFYNSVDRDPWSETCNFWWRTSSFPFSRHHHPSFRMEQCQDYPWAPHVSSDSSEDSTKNSSRENLHYDQKFQTGFRSCCFGVKKVNKGD